MSQLKLLQSLNLALSNIPNIPRIKEGNDDKSTPYLESFILFSTPSVWTLGPNGENMEQGTYQVNIHTNPNLGLKGMMETSDLICKGFESGMTFTYLDQMVRIRSSGLSTYQETPLDLIGVVQIEFYSLIKRVY